MVSRGPLPVLLLCFLVAASGVAQTVPTMRQIVEDAPDDARNEIVSNGEQFPDTFSRGKQDISALHMGIEGDTLLVRLDIGATHAGTSSLLYVVHFTLDGTTYFTCWNIQSAGLTTTYEEINQDAQLGCNRFSIPGETRVGPATRDGGVLQGTDDVPYVAWPVPLADLGSPGPDAVLTDVWADTWNRGINNEHVGATSPQSYYTWNRADRAPDEGVVTFPFAAPAVGSGPTEGMPKAAAGVVNLALNGTDATVGPGSNATFLVEAALSAGTAAVSFNLTGLPPGWSMAAIDDVDLNASLAPAVINVTVMVPATASNATVPLVLEALVDGNVTASLGLNITIDVALAATSEVHGAPPAQEKDAPGLGMLGALLAIGVVLRRRR